MFDDERSDPEFADGLRARARRFHAFNWELLDCRDPELVSGALIVAADMVIDGLFHDLLMLNRCRCASGNPSVLDVDNGGVMVLDRLPPRFAARYTQLFTRRLIMAAGQVQMALTREWVPSACVAEELVLRLVIEYAAGFEDIVDLDADSFEGFAALAFDDIDNELLYDPALDGIEDDDAWMRERGVADMRVSAWFTAFPGRPVHPYTVE